MRYYHIVVILLAISTPTFALGNTPTINVSGNAEVLVVPDRLKLVMSVESRHEKLHGRKS